MNQTINKPKKLIRNSDIATRMSQIIPEIKQYQMKVLIKLYWSELLRDIVEGKICLVEGVATIRPVVKRYKDRVVYSGKQKIRYTTDVIDARIFWRFRKPIREQLRKNALEGKVELIEIEKPATKQHTSPV